ncbi:MAG: dTMP kinase [Planctomycetota bacterium]
MSDHQNAGRFLSIDGVDGAGKSTQVERIAAHLESAGHDVICVRDPGSTELGSKLRALLLDSDLDMHRRTEAMLFMASRSEMIEQRIRPALAAGQIVISDRFLLSTVVYQSVGAPNQRQCGVPAEQLWQLGRLACDGLQPQLTVLLDMPAERSLQRLHGDADRMESRGLDYMRAVRDAYLQQLPLASPHTHVVDAGAEIDDVTRRLIAVIDQWLQQ